MWKTCPAAWWAVWWAPTPALAPWLLRFLPRTPNNTAYTGQNILPGACFSGKDKGKGVCVKMYKTFSWEIFQKKMIEKLTELRYNYDVNLLILNRPWGYPRPGK